MTESESIALAQLRSWLGFMAAREKGTVFMGWPDRWWDSFLRRCPNNHVSATTLGTEKGDRCLACRAPVCMTFPEDVDGPLDLRGNDAYSW